jgi:hypothetical protein
VPYIIVTGRAMVLTGKRNRTMITKNYNNIAMTGIGEADYETLLTHLVEQLAAKLGTPNINWPEENAKAASDALNNTWQEDMTAREWLAVAGRHLGVDTTDCVGA